LGFFLCTINLMAKTKKRPLRVKIGIGILIVSVFSPLLALLIPFFELPAGMSAIVVGFVAVGLPEILLLIGVALAGKEVWFAILNKLRKIAKRVLKPKPIGKFRYDFGLGMFVLSLFIPFFTAYANYLFLWRLSGHAIFYLNIVSDVLLIASFFVMGMQFLDKLRLLFIWEKNYTPE